MVYNRGPGIQLAHQAARLGGASRSQEIAENIERFFTINYAKQTQFPKSQNEYKLNFNKGLQKKR